LPAAPAAGARLASANALLTGLSAYAHQLLQTGQIAYTSRYNILRQTYMPKDRWAFVSAFYGATEVDAITTVHLRSFLDLLQYRVEVYHTDWGHGFNTSNNIYRRSGETLVAIGAARAALPPDAQAVFFDGWDWKNSWAARIETECAFWSTEIPAFRQRLAKWTQMVAAAQAGAGITVTRNVTQGEADHVRQDHGLRQGLGSFEKHKFFGGPGAAPGSGVLHPIVLTIVLKQGVYQWIQNNSTEGAPVGVPVDYNFASFSKAAEPHCYGIHEDALGIFNTLIHRISIAKAPGQQINYAPKAAFDPAFVATYPNDYHFPT
jgi:hypothetical protein